MSEPRHIKALFFDYDDGTYAISAYLPETPTTSRDHRLYTLTDGPEYASLIERAREALEGAHAWDCHYDSIGECSCSIHALTRMLAWLEGTP